MTINIDIKGLKRLERRFKGITKAFEPALKKTAEVVRTKLFQKRYAPKRPRQKYIRTGRLGRSWSPARKRGNLTYVITNDAKNPKSGVFYTNYVIGDKQAWMHAGRWWTARRVVEDEPPKIIVTFTAEINKALKDG